MMRFVFSSVWIQVVRVSQGTGGNLLSLAELEASKNPPASRIASRALHCTLRKTLSVPKQRTRAHSFFLNFSRGWLQTKL